MPSNAAVIEQFYAAFARRDAEAMAACYAPDVMFADLTLTVRDVVADEQAGSAHWEAIYQNSRLSAPAYGWP